MAEAVFIVRNSAGAVVFDSRDAFAGVCVGIIDVPGGTPQTYTFPNYVGRTLKVAGMWGTLAWGAAVDYALGYPRLTVDSAAARTFVLFMQ
ncbi:hypothetical protein [Aquincola tertiaricarbonis]|uniref:hypothetical protein n=1 Tax=Aquincola tertiaricarbonis TaxID=391953 RepID=UPI0006151B7C|nr:hypothetical protein [Aquincola tertiaricarbonis]